MTTVLEDITAVSGEGHEAEFEVLGRALRPQAGRVKIVDALGNTTEIPEPIYQALLFIVEAVEKRQVINLVPANHLLTTNQAADFLNVSRPFVVKLLEQNELPYTRVGTHRRIAFEDLVAYQQRRRVSRRDGLREIATFSQLQAGDAGELYEDEPLADGLAG
jgi:excisionase family DNA binding protein